MSIRSGPKKRVAMSAMCAGVCVAAGCASTSPQPGTPVSASAPQVDAMPVPLRQWVRSVGVAGVQREAMAWGVAAPETDSRSELPRFKVNDRRFGPVCDAPSTWLVVDEQRDRVWVILGGGFDGAVRWLGPHPMSRLRAAPAPPVTRLSAG